MIQEISRAEAVSRAEELATPLNDLIRPSDVHDGAEEWSDVRTDALRHEINQSVDIIMSEMNYHHAPLKDVLYRRALTLHKDHMIRVPMDHVVWEDEKSAVEERYWPYGTSRGEVMELLCEIYPTLEDLPTDDYQDAYMDVSEGLQKGMVPEGVEL